MSAIIRMVAKRSFEQICVGDKGTVSKTITEADVANFAGMTGDFNPLHVNQEYAKSSRFGQQPAARPRAGPPKYRFFFCDDNVESEFGGGDRSCQARSAGTYDQDITEHWLVILHKGYRNKE